MAITTQDGLIAALANAQTVTINKLVGRTTVLAAWTSFFEIAGNVGAGVLAGTSTAAGVVPTDATVGCPPIRAFGVGKTGYISGAYWGQQVTGRLRLCDMLFKAGAYSFNANVALAAQPSYASRIPGGDYKGTEIWFECVTNLTGNLTLNVTYTNQDGVTGRTAGAINYGTAIIGRMIQIQMQAGDTGVQKIESVVGTVATAGTFNILVLRPLIPTMPSNQQGTGGSMGVNETQLPIVFDDSALIVQLMASGVSAGTFDSSFNIVNG